MIKGITFLKCLLQLGATLSVCYHRFQAVNGCLSQMGEEKKLPLSFLLLKRFPYKTSSNVIQPFSQI